MGKRILIFDDDEDILIISSYILKSMGWEVIVKNNCSNILQIVKEIYPDIILMDNWVPDTGGVIATQTLKADPDLKLVPVIFFSADHEIEKLSKEAGADTYFMKPFEIADFEKIINSVYPPSSEKSK
ncbi:response regulator [soil metagenome]